MKKLKNTLSLLLAFVIIFSPSANTFANSFPTTKQIQVDNHSFEIKEKIGKNHEIIRTYENNENIIPFSTDPNQIKPLLIALGMETESVNNLSAETLKEFSESSQIIVSTIYSKTDSNNNVTYLDESVALEEASILKEQQDNIKTNIARGITTYADHSGIFKDSYMKLTYAVTYKGNGKYLYSVDATWLTMPFFRGYDSIGSCSMNSTVTNSTRSGYYTYDATYINNGTGGTVTHEKGKKQSITNFKNAINGNWYGSVGIFNLPNNVDNSYVTTFYDNLKAHYQYRGHVTTPNQSTWFNTVASYDHSTVSISINTPSASIDLNGKFSASIGLSIAGSTDTRSVELEVHYIP